MIFRKNLEGPMPKLASRHKILLGILVVSSMGVGYALGQQPHMDAALGLLQNARIELARAEPNKGGHRERGLALIDQAMGEVRAGIAFGAGR
jgi:hypothetical protein